MRYFFYIVLIILCFSCAQKEQAAEDMTVTTESTQNASESDPSAAADDMEEPAAIMENTANSSMDIVIQQQLQETLNLIVLHHKMDLSSALNEELRTTIQNKVNAYQVAKDIDVLEIETIEISSLTEEPHTLQITFKAMDKAKHIYMGHGTAVVSVEQVNIDGENYENYQIFFETIIME